MGAEKDNKQGFALKRMSCSINPMTAEEGGGDSNNAVEVDMNTEVEATDADAAEQTKATNESPISLVPDIEKQIIVEVGDEDKDSGFGDYGTESSDESHSFG